MDNIMMPGNFLVLNIWVGSLFSMRVSAAFQIYFKCKSNNTNELLALNIFPGPITPLAFLCHSAVGRACQSAEAGGVDCQEASVSSEKQSSAAETLTTQRLGHFLSALLWPQAG